MQHVFRPMKHAGEDVKVGRSYIVRPLEKAIQVLRCVSAAPSALTLKEISGREMDRELNTFGRSLACHHVLLILVRSEHLF